MGEVYLAEQSTPIRRRVALKVIKRGMDTHEVIARFETERQALAMMDHPCIAKVFDAGSTPDGRPYFIMENVAGVPITRFADRSQLTTTQRLELFIQVCEGVQHAHQKAIIHRDLKPSNILVTETDNRPLPKVIDFGIAKAIQHRLTDNTVYTEIGRMIGTPEYMSPEQAELTGEDIDTRTDVYTLGVVLYELLCGVLPFESHELRRASRGEMQRMLREKDPPRPSTRASRMGDSTVEAARRSTSPARLTSQLRGDLDWIIMKALAKDRARRYASPSALAEDIRRHLRNEPVLAGPPSAVYRMSKFVRRHRVGVAFAGSMLVLLVAFAATMAVQARRIAHERDRANVAASEARREAETAQRTSDFLVELFEESDPGQAQGKDLTAREILDRGAERLDQELKDRPEIRAPLLRTIGRVYSVMSLYPESEALLREAVALGEVHADERPLEYATSLVELATALDGAGKSAAALPFAERAVEIRRHELGDSDPELATALHRLGVVYWHNDRIPEAEVLMREALGILEASRGRNHISVTRVLHNLASLRFLQNDLDEAQALYEETMALEEDLKGPKSFELATTMHTLAMIHQQRGELERALDLESRSLAIREEVLGSDHPHVSLSLTTLGQIYQSQGRPEAAVPLLQRALAISERKWGPAHDDTNWTRRTLARICNEVGQYARAESLMTRSIEMEENQDYVSLDLRARARSYLLRGRIQEAETGFLAAVEAAETAYGPDDTWAALARADLANLWRDQSRFEEAESAYVAALRVMEAEWGAQDPDRLSTLAEYVQLLEKMGEVERAAGYRAEIDSLRQ